jgi:hypothetical protein
MKSLLGAPFLAIEIQTKNKKGSKKIGEKTKKTGFKASEMQEKGQKAKSCCCWQEQWKASHRSSSVFCFLVRPVQQQEGRGGGER